MKDHFTIETNQGIILDITDTLKEAKKIAKKEAKQRQINTYIIFQNYTSEYFSEVVIGFVNKDTLRFNKED